MQFVQLLGFFLLLLVVFLVPSPTRAAGSVTVTPITGGAHISADTTGGAYTALTGPIIEEGGVRNIGLGSIVLSLPTGFQFDTSSAITATVTKAGLCSANTTVLLSGALSQTVTPSAATVTVTVTQQSSSHATCQSTVTFSGIKARPTAGTPLASGTVSHTGTSVVSGVDGSTSFGALTEVVGALASITVAPPSASVMTGNTQQFTAASIDHR